ncbi:MAG: hypothetical protein ABI867_01940 [Kofleriaceae bacterium]
MTSRRSRGSTPWATRNHVEQLAIQIAEMGLPDSDGLDDWTQLSDGPSAGIVAVPASVTIPPKPASPEPPPIEARTAEPAPVSESPREDAWEVEKPTFVARHRRWVYTGVCAVILLALAIIPYPLYMWTPLLAVNLYVVYSNVKNLIPLAKPQWRSGMTGLARIYVPPRSIGYRLIALPILRIFDFDLWRVL